MSGGRGTNRFLDTLAARHSDECLVLKEQPLYATGTAVALAPHPDDPDAIAVTLRMLALGGCDLYWVILTSSWSGVEDAFAGPSREAKARVREEEQKASVAFFGLLRPDRLSFLRLAEGEDGHLLPVESNYWRVARCLETIQPDLVLLPWREDTNPTHRLAYELLSRWASLRPTRTLALENEDPKSLGFEPHLQVVFGERTAAWKGRLLECHQSQSVRNQHTRNMTFADRILGINRACPGLLHGEFSERFQVEMWGG